MNRILVFGMARSGIAAAMLMLHRGEEVWICDKKKLEDFHGSLDKLIEAGAHAMLGEEHPEDRLEGFDLVVISPGIPVEHPIVQRAADLGVELIGEIEYAYRESAGELIAITGTNGKTTTVTLTGEIYKNAGMRTHVVGNIGSPYSESVLQMRENDVTVCEISSFMMETSDTFHPHIAAVLNISEDHLNRHHTMERYIRLKERIFEKCGKNDFVVLNYDDPETRKMADHTSAHVLWFSSRTAVPRGAFVKDGNVVFGSENDFVQICACSDIYIPGEHNLRNALSAAAIAMSDGIAPEIIAHTLRTFRGVEHRIEFVRELDGIRYINDSKGTNPDSTIQAVRAMKRPTVLILGGYPKNNDFTPLVKEILSSEIRHIVLIGDTAMEIEGVLKKLGFASCEHCGYDFRKAVEACRRSARPGWNVLLSPSCASFDMFDDYEQRGRVFKEIVMALEPAGA